MKKLFLGLLFLMVLLSAVNVCAEGNWQSNKHLWESLVPDKDNLRKIQGGDINGDLKDDIALFYNEKSTYTLLVLVSRGAGYALVPFEPLSADIFGKKWLSRVDSVGIENNVLSATVNFEINQLIPELNGVKETALRFVYSEDRIRLMEVVSTGSYADGSNAHVFYNVQEGQIYFHYLAKAEKVGENNSYYFRSYSRVVAPRVKTALPINGDGNKWVMLARPQWLTNNAIGNRITYGFDKWRSDKDLSGKYYVAHDEKNIYLYVQVIDDVVRQSFSGDKMLRGDHIELWFAKPSGEKYQIGLNPGDFGKILPEAVLWYSGYQAVNNQKLSNIEIKSRRIDGGYIMEARIPLGTLYATDWKEIPKFTMVLSDSDQSDRQEKIMASSSLTWSSEYSLGEILWK